ncbi:hypothetical protein RRG08_055915 [Elysia crispata]|uniref:Uncharacterized protein n=1 Tax=Elysia crispata TaxID=231223 RepID=A0AAE0Y4J8_9GAST|nr:hypothetical protein RRG08_055915 [Elysia crispata]
MQLSGTSRVTPLKLVSSVVTGVSRAVPHPSRPVQAQPVPEGKQGEPRAQRIAASLLGPETHLHKDDPKSQSLLITAQGACLFAFPSWGNPFTKRLGYQGFQRFCPLIKCSLIFLSVIRIDGGPGKFRTQRLTLLDLTPQRAMYEIKQTDREERRTKKNQKAEEVKDKHRSGRMSGRSLSVSRCPMLPVTRSGPCLRCLLCQQSGRTISYPNIDLIHRVTAQLRASLVNSYQFLLLRSLNTSSNWYNHVQYCKVA